MTNEFNQASDRPMSMELSSQDKITIKTATDRDIDEIIQRTHPDGTEWKIVYDDPRYPSSYFIAARGLGYFGMGIRAVLVPLSAFVAWQGGFISEPPRPRSDHMFDNKAGAFDWLNTITPSIQQEFARERNLSLPTSVRTTADVGMQPLRERANPFR